jgi:hypothetical protein
MMNTLNESMTNGAQRSSRCGGKEKHQNTFRAILQLTDVSEICCSFSLLKEKFLVKNERQANGIAKKKKNEVSFHTYAVQTVG